jgi:NADH:ubiquinone oxidoreductase subunit 4 (subunit M)
VLFPIATAFYTPFIYILSACGVVYASLTTLQQVDLKKIIAYSSVGHMAIVTIGIFSNTYQGILGSIVLMIGHGITSSGLFITIGMLYERYNTRIIKYYSGLMHTMPIFSSAFILLTLGNLGLPLTSNFIGEVLVIVGIFIKNT